MRKRKDIKFKFINTFPICGFEPNQIYSAYDEGLGGFYKFIKDNTYYDMDFIKMYFIEYTYKEEFKDKLENFINED